MEQNKNKIEQQVKDDKIRINLLKSELSYFKGLAVLMTVLILCVFFAFGALFSAMYLEVKMLRQSMQGILNEVLIIKATGDNPNSLQLQQLNKNIANQIKEKINQQSTK